MGFLKVELVCLLVFVGFYLLGTLLVYFKVSQPARYAFDMLPTPTMDVITKQEFKDYVNAIEMLGFDLVANLYSENPATNTRHIISLLYNRSVGDQAIASEISASNNGTAVKSTLYIEFVSEFTDGREICTNNSKTLGVFAPVPEKPIYQFPEIKNAASLYSIHSALARDLNAYKSPLPLEGNEVSTLVDGIERSLVRQTKTGYMYLDDSSQTYRPTLKGAAIMTFKSLWPASTIRKHRARSRSLNIRKKYQIAVTT